MSNSTTDVDEVSNAMAVVDLSSSAFARNKQPTASSTLPAPKTQEEFTFADDVDGALFSQQSWACETDSVRQRLRGILITHDTYDLLRLSFKDDLSARQFLGVILGTMSSSGDIVRMSELQLEELTSHWDEAEEKPIDPQFKPVDLPLLVSFNVAYSLSTKWEIVKTLHYIALSQDIFETLCEDAICSFSLNELHNAKHTAIVDKIPHLRHSGKQHSVEFEFNQAVKYSSSAKPNESPLSKTIERLVEITKIGRRERSEPFLRLSEISVPRLRPRESMENICQAIKVVYSYSEGGERNEQNKGFRMRVLVFRRPVGTIGKMNLDKALARSLNESTAVYTLLDRGQSSRLQLDKDASKLLRCAKQCYLEDGTRHTKGCTTGFGGVAKRMFSVN